MLVEELTEIDYSILRFVKKNQPVGVNEIKQKFSKFSSLEYRIKLLSTAERREVGHTTFPIDNSYFLSEKYSSEADSHVLVGLKIYSLTDYAEKALQDHRAKSKQENFQMWLKNAWIPIIVSLITNLLIVGTKLLLQQIQ